MSSRFGARALSALIMMLALGGCAGRAQPPEATSPPSAEGQLAWGQQFAARGESVRAEQYYLSALELGADDETVFALVVDTCIESGRLGSALRYVEERLRRHPEDAALLRLAASLREALGHGRRAWQLVERLERVTPRAPAETLFLAEFYDRAGAEPEQCLRYYRAYLDEIPLEEREPWVTSTVRRLEESLAGQVSQQDSESHGFENQESVGPSSSESVAVDSKWKGALYEHRK